MDIPKLLALSLEGGVSCRQGQQLLPFPRIEFTRFLKRSSDPGNPFQPCIRTNVAGTVPLDCGTSGICPGKA